MLEKAQERSWLRTLGIGYGPKLYGAQKALSQWAIVDDYNAILDLHCRDTRLLHVLSQQFSLRACGIAEDVEAARCLQENEPGAEIFCARKEDIPWRDGCFDVVFYQMKKGEAEQDPAFLKEALRVLKPNGQMLVALQGAPEILCKAGELMGIAGMEDRVKPKHLLAAMEAAGFEDLSFRIAQPFVGIAMGWKRDMTEEYDGN